MIKIDGSLIIQIINFLLLIWLLNTIMYRPIRKILKQRSEKVDGLEKDISQCQESAEEKDKAYTVGLKEARTEGLKEKDKLVKAAEKEEKALIQKINENALAELNKVKKQVAKEAEDVRASLINEVEVFAKEIGQKILGRAV